MSKYLKDTNRTTSFSIEIGNCLMIEELDVESFIGQECEVCGGNVYACYCLDEEFGDE